MKKNILIVAPAFIALFLFSCATVAPVNTSYERAATLGKGGLELSGSYTHYSFSGDGESAATNNNYGGKVGYGINDKMDIKVRYEQLVPVDMGPGSKIKVNYMSVIPKYSIKDKKIAFLLPLSRYNFKDESEAGETFKDHSYSIAPQFIGTITDKKNKADLSFSVKGDLVINSEGSNDFLLGFSGGAGISSNLDKWAIR
ncbi:MAG TPA: hypothetical protein VJ499_01970, partial [Flavisolibacter sp.]|nr:hypothetical protein [Flavisolibacter sp.]